MLLLIKNTNVKIKMTNFYFILKEKKELKKSKLLKLFIQDLLF